MLCKLRNLLSTKKIRGPIFGRFPRNKKRTSYAEVVSARPSFWPCLVSRTKRFRILIKLCGREFTKSCWMWGKFVKEAQGFPDLLITTFLFDRLKCLVINVNVMLFTTFESEWKSSPGRRCLSVFGIGRVCGVRLYACIATLWYKEFYF